MRILGIDPGSRHCGWGVIERSGNRFSAVGWGRLSPDVGRPLAERLLEIAAGLGRIIELHRPHRAVVERVFHGASARSLIVLAEARGAILVELARHGLAVEELAPAEVKSAVAGSGRADKAQVGRMVRLTLALPAGPLAADASDALAVAVAGAQRGDLARRLAAAAHSA
ncbi:MAG: crossover junction endodeoxyribonuclease RuvC [Acidobacteriota bacterium]